MGATIKDAQKLPQHLVADEKHTWLAGKRVYIPTTVAEGCILGVSFTQSASVEALTKGYQEFQTEARLLNPDYAPVTVNTDAWVTKNLLALCERLCRRAGSKPQILRPQV